MEINRRRKTFEFLDTDNSGKIDRDEFKKRIQESIVGFSNVLFYLLENHMNFF